MKPIFVVTAIVSALFAAHCLGDDAGKSVADPTCNGARTHDWHAWNNRMPMSDQAVHVTGKAGVNSGGWKASLTKRSDQGTNASLLLLNLDVSPPRGPTIQPMLELKLDYTETNSAGKYQRARIFCVEKLVADIPVEDAH